MFNSIVLSGGWGYSNLGDDAILASCISVIRGAYPDSRIKIMSYDPDTTARLFRQDNIEFYLSPHRVLDGGLTLKRFGIAESGVSSTSGNIVSLALKRVLKGIREKQERFLASSKKKRDEAEALLESVFLDSDLFVQCGGGYFNSDWPTSLVAHTIELFCATSRNIPTLLIGQSIVIDDGSPDGRAALRAIKLADYVSVRDGCSCQILKDAGIGCSVLPDCALAELIAPKEPSSSGSGKKVTIVCNSDALDMTGNMIRLLEALQKVGQCDFLVTFSRVWHGDVFHAKRLSAKLVRQGHKCTYVVPQTYADLQRLLLDSDLVISQNLHGLVLSVRSGIPVIAFNGYQQRTSNYEKISSFVEQVGETAYMMNRASIQPPPKEFLANLLRSKKNAPEKAKNLNRRVIEGALKAFDQLECL